MPAVYSMPASTKGYVDLKYRPGPNDLIAEFYVEPNNISIESAAENIASESSIGTWTDISTMQPEIAKKLKPSVYSISKINQASLSPGLKDINVINNIAARNNAAVIKIAYPSELFEQGNMPQILSSIAGNIFGMKAVSNLRLNDIVFPKKLVRSFKGPEFGIDGIRKLTKVKHRPLLGTIIKPKVGLPPELHAKVAYDAWSGGCDIVKDDENLSSMSFNNFDERVRQTLALRDKAQSETGEAKIYMPNISSEFSEMVRRADFIKAHRGTYMMIDILTVGWSALQGLRNLNKNLVIHAHRAGHAILTRNPKHGMSMLAIAKIARLIGVDQLHIGAVIGKMEGSSAEITEIEHEIVKDTVVSRNALRQNWYGIKPVLPVCSGGLHPGHVPELIKIMGKDIAIQMGGGIHWNPKGTLRGARGARQALDAVMRGKKLQDYAKAPCHEELREAIERFGALNSK